MLSTEFGALVGSDVMNLMDLDYGVSGQSTCISTDEFELWCGIVSAEEDAELDLFATDDKDTSKDSICSYICGIATLVQSTATCDALPAYGDSTSSDDGKKGGSAAVPVLITLIVLSAAAFLVWYLKFDGKAAINRKLSPTTGRGSMYDTAEPLNTESPPA